MAVRWAAAVVVPGGTAARGAPGGGRRGVQLPAKPHHLRGCAWPTLAAWGTTWATGAYGGARTRRTWRPLSTSRRGRGSAASARTRSARTDCARISFCADEPSQWANGTSEAMRSCPVNWFRKSARFSRLIALGTLPADGNALVQLRCSGMRPITSYTRRLRRMRRYSDATDVGAMANPSLRHLAIVARLRSRLRQRRRSVTGCCCKAFRSLRLNMGVPDVVSGRALGRRHLGINRG